MIGSRKDNLGRKITTVIASGGLRKGGEGFTEKDMRERFGGKSGSVS